MRYIAFSLVIASLFGCRSVTSARIHAENQNEMLTAVRTIVPVGTSIDVAQSQMEHAGFECTLIQDGSFSESPGYIGDDREYRNVSNANYLECWRSERAGFLVSHLWSVAIVYDDAHAVSDLLVLHQMNGP